MTADQSNLLQALRAEAGLTKSERRLAAVICAQPEEATRWSIATLAQRAAVSEPTAHRFCRKFEGRGYPAFKLRLAQSLVAGVPYLSAAVAADDDAEAIAGKIIAQSCASLSDLQAQLPPARLDAVIDALLSAQRILFFGLGVSSAVAQDAQQHFFRFALPVSAQGDILMQRSLAASAASSDLFFLISHTGRTREVVDVARLAVDRGATVVALTAANSPLARASTLAIELRLAEDTDAYMPMTSRLAHLVVLDILAAGVALRRGETLHSHLRAVKESLRPTRLPLEEETP